MNRHARSVAQIVKTAAREELLPRFAKAERSYKSDGSIVTEADVAMQQRMTGELAAFSPQYRLLGEEMTEEEQSGLLRAGEGGLWCLDPLDGTSNFASGIPFFSVSLGLLIDRKPYLGLVYDPLRDECFTAILAEAGGCMEKLCGGPVFSLQLQPSSAVAASDPDLFADWKNWLATHQ